MILLDQKNSGKKRSIISPGGGDEEHDILLNQHHHGSSRRSRRRRNAAGESESESAAPSMTTTMTMMMTTRTMKNPYHRVASPVLLPVSQRTTRHRYLYRYRGGSSLPPSNGNDRVRGRGREGSSFAMVLLPWLYFLAVQLNTATMPKYIHWILSGRPGDDALRNAQMSSLSATVYGNMCAIDSLFTFFSVNFLGCVSDHTRRRGRRRRGGGRSSSQSSSSSPSLMGRAGGGWRRAFGGFGRTRRPFMFLSSLGLGISHVCIYVCI